eukprot:10641924-Alexandrium_andersonii.AAC.1
MIAGNECSWPHCHPRFTGAGLRPWSGTLLQPPAQPRPLLIGARASVGSAPLHTQDPVAMT